MQGPNRKMLGRKILRRTRLSGQLPRETLPPRQPRHLPNPAPNFVRGRAGGRLFGMVSQTTIMKPGSIVRDGRRGRVRLLRMAPPALDSYVWKARVLPAVIASLPVALLAFAWWPEASPDWKTLSGVVVIWLAIAGVVEQFVTDRGVQIERKLFETWGGRPTTHRLRYRSGSDARELELLHRRLEIVCGMTLPTRKMEERQPDNADRQYEACVDILREKTRDHSLVHAENCNYGLRRNLLALKPLGLLLALGSLATMVVVGSTRGLLLSVELWIAIMGNLLLLGMWLIGIRPNWVRRAAERYARQLFATGNAMEVPNLR